MRIYIPKDLRQLENRQSVGKSVKEVIKRFPDGVPLLDPIEDMKVEDADFKKVVRVRKIPRMGSIGHFPLLKELYQLLMFVIIQ